MFLINLDAKTNWKYIIIVVLLTVLSAGGILSWQYFGAPKKEKIKEAKLISFEIIPSCAGEAGWIIYPKNAKAAAVGQNLSKVEFWKSPTGTGIEDMIYTDSKITKRSNQWEAVLPDILYITDFYAVGYDDRGMQVDKISLGDNVYGSDQYGRYPEDCKKDETADTSTSLAQGWQTYRNEEFGFEVKYPENTVKNFPQITASKIDSATYSEARIGEFEQGCTLYILELPNNSSNPSELDYVASDIRKGNNGTLFFGMRAASRAVDPQSCQLLLDQFLSPFRFLPLRLSPRRASPLAGSKFNWFDKKANI